MSDIRRAAIAGSFYPNNKEELKVTVDHMLSLVSSQSSDTPAKALIAPHAGYIYSGTIAAEAYINIDPKIKKVVLLGPSHHVAFRGMAMSSAKFFETPLGKIEIDSASQKKISTLSNVTIAVNDQAHEKEHSIEIHLPFLQSRLGHFKLIPIVVGDASKEEVAEVLEILWGGPETLILISSDLSHFHHYDQAKSKDDKTASRILRLESNLSGDNACGCRVINGFTHFINQQNSKFKRYDIKQLSVKSSGDTAGDRQRVVGYGAFMLTETRVQALSTANRQQLLQVARQAIQHALTSRDKFNIDLGTVADNLKVPAASFVTINIDGQLRGCIGSLQAHRSLILDIANNAQSAAFRDPRFAALTIGEFQKITLHISVLSEPENMGILDFEGLLTRIRPGVDGIILEENGKRATYLPSVWEQLSEPKDFLRTLRQKAGLPPQNWHECRVQRYTTEEFS
ncbi:MAG: AmmeMemoRadiSam system protein B/AmmeMemoRadiSam system protein A [Flavobacterium sp.]|jgi:AmmeMemoRadiSam system protein B/AmmeMemoRadiSam system protein A